MSDVMIRTVTVYAGSAPDASVPLKDLAGELGAGIAARGWILVYGGATIGLMGAVADAALARGGRVEGVILDTFARVAHHGLHELATVTDMRSRKAGLAHRGDAFVALPGGFGTLEELLEQLTGRLLGFHDKPIVLADTDGFWDPLLELFEHLYRERFARPESRDAYAVAHDASGVMALLDAPPRPLPGKWL